MANLLDACPHLKYQRTSRAYKCDSCGLPLVIHSVPMTLSQVQEFEKMRRKQADQVRRHRGSGLVLPNEVKLKTREESA